MYFDSNIFLFYLLLDPLRYEFQRADYYIRQVIIGQNTGFTATLTWDEVFYIVKRNYNLNDAVNVGNYLFRMPNLKIVDVDFQTIKDAQNISFNYNINPRDAIHAVLAIKYSNGDIISHDTDFDIISGINRLF